MMRRIPCCIVDVLYDDGRCCGFWRADAWCRGEVIRCWLQRGKARLRELSSTFKLVKLHCFGVGVF